MKFLSKYIIIITLIIISSEVYSQSDTLVIIYKNGTEFNFAISTIKMATFIGALLTTMYGFIFTLIQLEDYALLIGSIGLFVTLAFVMYFSRKIKWVS